MRAAIALLSVLFGVGVLRAADAPVVGLEELNRAPEKYEGKAILVRAEVSGAIAKGEVWHRLTVRTAQGVIVPNKLRNDGITFVIAKSDTERLAGGWKEDQFVPVRLAVKVWKGERGNWHAIVSGVEKMDPPTVAQLNENPQDFVGQTLIFDRVEVSGDAQRLPGRYGLTVKADKTEYKPVPDGKQKVRFASPDQSEKVRKALDVFKPGSANLVRLTVQVEKVDKADFVATVTRIDLIRFEDEKTPADGAAALVATAEDVVADHKKFSGKLVAFDRMRLTKESHDGPARTLIGVQTPAGTEFKGVEGKGVRFALPGKGNPVKTYRETRWKDDIDQPVRLVCGIGETPGQRIVIHRIDRVLELRAEDVVK